MGAHPGVIVRQVEGPRYEHTEAPAHSSGNAQLPDHLPLTIALLVLVLGVEGREGEVGGQRLEGQVHPSSHSQQHVQQRAAVVQHQVLACSFTTG